MCVYERAAGGLRRRAAVDASDRVCHFGRHHGPTGAQHGALHRQLLHWQPRGCSRRALSRRGLCCHLCAPRQLRLPVRPPPAATGRLARGVAPQPRRRRRDCRARARHRDIFGVCSAPPRTALHGGERVSGAAARGELRARARWCSRHGLPRRGCQRLLRAGRRAAGAQDPVGSRRRRHGGGRQPDAAAAAGAKDAWRDQGARRRRRRGLGAARLRRKLQA
mmetsp:Transcript_41678/g.131664  ORF Transcript_41678/g.131664 Transcript_41678/m.131664 type:complete len:221 (-) Transcript_41678:200-862(-)